jgi:aminoglycoside phosphotransferase family enzyme/predicted kinase
MIGGFPLDDQREVVSFLSDGVTYGMPGLRVERIETHISMIFLVGDRAFKLKRAVRFSYLDYSTTTLRGVFCKKELDLNLRTAASLYVRVRAITRQPGGNLAFDGAGTVIDWVVEMRRFAQTDLFDQLAQSKTLDFRLMRDLTDGIAEFHVAAEITPQYGGRAGIEETIEGNNVNLVQSTPPLDGKPIQELYAASMAKLAALGGLLDSRRERGRVRRCHGDLHLRNVCLFEGRPTLFDCIEFNDALSCIDVLYDLAFLLMDLVRQDLNDLASVVFNRYLDLTADIDGLSALPLFMSVRAAIRAHVAGALGRQNQSPQALAEARSYLSLAGAFLHPNSPILVAIGGLSGVGKSTVAQALAPDFKPSPGARVVRSDVVRKHVFNVTPETKLPRSAYENAVTERVYGALQDEVLASLTAGYTTIADATFLREEERRRIAASAERCGVPFVGLWLEAPSETLEARIGARSDDASDADLPVMRQQLSVDIGAVEWQRIRATSDVTGTLAAARVLTDQNVAKLALSRPDHARLQGAQRPIAATSL